jgi:choline dehydrogenase-like flavoprotein
MFDLIVVGTSFASSFFLQEYLKKADSTRRILVLERGRKDSHSWQLENKTPTSIRGKDTFINENKKKPWTVRPVFGGASNSWWACAPRLLPNDFRLKTLYGVGRDWPVSYDELEEFYCRAEEIMEVSGPVDTPFPRSRPYSQPPHLLNDPDKLLQAAHPGMFISQPTARARVKATNRQKCSARGVCEICPNDAKFTVLNGLAHIYEDPRVTLILEANVMAVEYRGTAATGITYINNGVTQKANADLVVLGAGAIFNPFILLNSGIDQPMTGKGLCEQVSINVMVNLDGVDSFQGSTMISANGFFMYDGEHRSQRATFMTESHNIPTLQILRPERGKWRQRMVIKFIFEDIPEERNFVKISEGKEDMPETVYIGHSDYLQRGLDSLPEILPRFLEQLPVEDYKISDQFNSTESHIIGTTIMGNDAATSVIDRYLVHHKIRNLVVLGSGAFPTAPPPNPSLTLGALSLWSAAKLLA